MNYRLKRDLLKYFQQIESPTEEEKLLKIRLEGDIQNFDIVSVSREDIAAVIDGVDESSITDSFMERFADKMADSYLETGYWEDVRTHWDWLKEEI